MINQHIKDPTEYLKTMIPQCLESSMASFDPDFACIMEVQNRGILKTLFQQAVINAKDLAFKKFMIITQVVSCSNPLVPGEIIGEIQNKYGQIFNRDLCNNKKELSSKIDEVEERAENYSPEWFYIIRKMQENRES